MCITLGVNLGNGDANSTDARTESKGKEGDTQSSEPDRDNESETGTRGSSC